MFKFLRKKRISKYAFFAELYLQSHFNTNTIIDFDEQSSASHEQETEVKYSMRGENSSNSQPTKTDSYNASKVSQIMLNYSSSGNWEKIVDDLEKTTNQTFVDRLLYYICIKDMRDSAVYKAAQIDKRLFSKIVSNRDYKPAKDTAIALAFGLKLTLAEANDLLSRAGYTFSHSNKRDIIIEFFFRQQIHNLVDINDVLYRLDQKLIGRF